MKQEGWKGGRVEGWKGKVRYCILLGTLGFEGTATFDAGLVGKLLGRRCKFTPSPNSRSMLSRLS